MLVYQFPGQNLAATLISWTPTVTSSAGAITSITYNRREAYRVGQLIYIHLDFTITNAGTGSGSLIFPPPVAPLAGTFPTLLGRETAVAGDTLIAVLNPSGGGSFIGFRLNGTTSIATNRRNVFAGFYISS
jgi:hypothetical protein